jgi:hypothetical protein
MTEKKELRIGPDGIPRGWLKDELAKRTVKAKITDPEERKAFFESLGEPLRGLGPGARTIPRRGRGYYPRGY